MRDYEIVYIFKSVFTSDEIDARLERYHGILTSADGAEITAVEQWGKRQLAYPIRKETNGHYVVAQFTTAPEALAQLERTLKLDEDLLRFLIVISEGELPIPESVFEERASRATADAAAEARKAEEVAAVPSESVEAPAEAAEAEVPVAEVVEESEDVVAEVVEESEEAVAEVVEESEEAVAEVVEESEEVVTEAVEEAEEAAAEVVEEAEEAAAEVVEKAEEAVAEVVQAAAGEAQEKE